MESKLILKSGNTRIDIETVMPFYCILVTYKTIIPYYRYIFSSIDSVCMLIYNVVTLIMLLLFIPLMIDLLSNIDHRKDLIPTIIISVCVVVNVIYAITQGGIGVLSRSYTIGMANGTNDYTGYYFSQINVWFGNMASVILLARFITNKRILRKCVIASMLTIVFPIVVIIITHPNYLGVRQSRVEGNDIVFGGGLWNAGVIGFGSLSWLGLEIASGSDTTKNQRRIIWFSVILFLFVGIAGISRTIILMAVFSFTVFFLFSKKEVNLLWKAILVLVAVGIIILVENDFFSTVLSRFTSEDSGTNNIRVLLWFAYLKHFKETWFIGAPLGSVYNYFHDVNLFGNFYLPHSAIVNFIIRFGLLSCIAYLWLIRNSFYYNKRERTYLRGKTQHAYFLAGLVSYITLAFMNQTGYGEPIFYLMFGLLLAYKKILFSDERVKINNEN